MQTIFFRSADRTLKFPGKKELALWIPNIFTEEGKSLTSLTYVFCSDEYLLKINRDFLQHDFYTDIVTFELSESKDFIEGEIYVSLDRVIDNAQTLGVALKDEILRVIFHGVLHLCGYRDKKDAEIKKMRQKEDHYISLYKAREVKK